MFRAPPAVVKEDTCAGSVAPMTTARIGGGDRKKVVRKPVEKEQGAGLKPDALTSFVSGYKKR